MLPVGGWWVGGSFGKSSHFVAPSCKLELARYSALPRIQDGAECGNSKVIIIPMNYDFCRLNIFIPLVEYPLKNNNVISHQELILSHCNQYII